MFRITHSVLVFNEFKFYIVLLISFFNNNIDIDSNKRKTNAKSFPDIWTNIQCTYSDKIILCTNPKIKFQKVKFWLKFFNSSNLTQGEVYQKCEFVFSITLLCMQV